MSDPAGRRPRRTLDGLLLLDKPSGITSNAALQRVKWLYQARKAGHTGSLDPLASGMLPICFGEATKFAGYLLEANKTYLVQARFGTRTDTADADGTPVETHSRDAVSLAELQPALASLLGPIDQVPPMYSALKQQGQRLYTLARAGKIVAREPRPVHIYEFGIESFDPQAPTLRVRCSKGTYVRTLVEDLASRLGTLAHVAALRRVAVEPFSGRPMVTIEELESAAGRDASADLGALDGLLQPLEAALPAWPAMYLDDVLAQRVSQGGPVVIPDTGALGPVLLYASGRRFLGVGEGDGTGLVVPRRLVAR